MDKQLAQLLRNIARIRREIRVQNAELQSLIEADIDCTNAARRLMRMQADLVLFLEKRERLILLQATVPITHDFEADKSAALEMIAEQFLRISHDYWDGRCDTDEYIDEGLKYEADREDSSRMEREIAVKFVDALALDGYTVARDMACNDFRLADDGGRAEFMEYVFEALIGEVTVYRPGAAHRFSFNFGGDGWDIIRSASGRLDVLIEATIEPYRAKGHAAKADRRYPVDCVYRKSKSERIDDEVRPVWRANL
jgi:hypothetical protein